jgi:hypothetical protein
LSQAPVLLLLVCFLDRVSCSIFLGWS